MKGEKSERSKRAGVRVSNGRQCDQELGALSIEPYGIPCALGLKLKEHGIHFGRAAANNWELKSVVLSSLWDSNRPRPATLKTDPCPDEHGTSSSAW